MRKKPQSVVPDDYRGGSPDTYLRRTGQEQDSPMTSVVLPPKPEGGNSRQAQRDAMRSIMQLQQEGGAEMRRQGEALRASRAAASEASEAYGSRAAQSGFGGALQSRGLQNILDLYGQQQARTMGQRAGSRSKLYAGVQDVRNLLDRKKYEQALSRAQALEAYWSQVIKDNLSRANIDDTLLKTLGLERETK
jgi:hypothetical protein